MTRRAKLLTAGELLDLPDPMDWIVRPLLVGGSTMMLYGRPGLGKSTLAMQLAAALAADGEDWLRFPIEAHGPVVWLQLDMPRPEMKMLLRRAVERWPAVLDRIHFFQLFQDDDEISEINVLRGDAELLARELEVLRPSALFVDTAADTYVANPANDANQEVRRVIRAFRHIAQGGCVIYIQHQRKSSTSGFGADSDGYLGSMGWAGMATSVFQITSRMKDGVTTYNLWKRKCRLAQVHFDKLELLPASDGFFEAAWPARAVLLGWPGNVPERLRGLSDRSDIMSALSKHFGIERDTLKKAAQRLAESEKPAWLR